MSTKTIRISTEHHKLLALYSTAHNSSIKDAIESAVVQLIATDPELQELIAQISNHATNRGLDLVRNP